jgi:hypothetical protein
LVGWRVKDFFEGLSGRGGVVLLIEFPIYVYNLALILAGRGLRRLDAIADSSPAWRNRRVRNDMFKFRVIKERDEKS